MAKKMGRPLIEIDKKEFEKLCELQCTKEDIANFFEVSEDTIERWCKRTYDETFAVVFKQKRVKGIISLRKHGFDMAKTNPSVHIFYAKNHLGMTDHVKVVEDVSENKIEALVEAIKKV